MLAHDASHFRRLAASLSTFFASFAASARSLGANLFQSEEISTSVDPLLISGRPPEHGFDRWISVWTLAIWATASAHILANAHKDWPDGASEEGRVLPIASTKSSGTMVFSELPLAGPSGTIR